MDVIGTLPNPTVLDCERQQKAGAESCDDFLTGSFELPGAMNEMPQPASIVPTVSDSQWGGCQDTANGCASLPGLCRRTHGPRAEEPHVRLLDVNLSIVGNGAEAVELLRRRRSHCGRAVLLWTDRPAACDDIPPNHTVNSSSLAFEASTFVWNPPSLDKPVKDLQVLKLRHEFSSWQRGLCRFGPDIVELDADELYDFVMNSQGVPSGVRVRNSTGVVWEMSGLVLFAGKYFGHVKACTSVNEASSIDVDVRNRELKPFASTYYPPVLLGAVIYFVQLLVFMTFMNLNEGTLRFDQLAWWRALFPAGTIFFGIGIIPDIWGYGLVGVESKKNFNLVGSLSAWLCFTFFSLCPVGQFGDVWYTWPPFSVCVLGTVSHLLLTLPFYLLWVRREYRSMCVVVAEIPWLRHIAWMLWLIVGSLGSWIIMYGIALFYVFLSQYSSVSAAMLLPFLTTLCEQAFAFANGFVYNHVIYRVASSGKPLFGYQRRHLVTVMMFTHSYAESTRLISLIASEVREPGYTWIASIISGLVIEVMIRMGHTTYLMIKVCPNQIRKRLKPSASKVLHGDCKYAMGYPRFVTTFALFFAELFVFGLDGRRVFTNGVILITISCLIVEVFVDLINSKQWFVPFQPWRAHAIDLYKPLAALHPSQVFATDRHGVYVHRTGLGFHGMTFPTVCSVLSIMAPGCYFSYCLCLLLLGAGYVHGACDNVLPDSVKVFDGLVWQTPLSCG